MTERDLAHRSGLSLSVVRAFEQTGKITLSGLIDIFRALGILDQIEALAPEMPPSPVALLEGRASKATKRVRRGRQKKSDV